MSFIEMVKKRIEVNNRMVEELKKFRQLDNLINKKFYMESTKYSLNKEELLKIAKGAGIATGGALLTYLAQLIPNVDFGANSVLIAAILSILINAGLKFLQGK